MTLSYNWLCNYLPATVTADEHIFSPKKLSELLTAIGLEVESLHTIGTVKGELHGLITGQVLSCVKHPDADKLSVAMVDIGAGEPLQIVCGASNIAAGQSVIVAPVSTTIYPTAGGEIEIKKAKIRGIESFGMICAEDEIGLGTNHDGIMVLPHTTKPGTLLSELLQQDTDHILEIGLTPNRIDAMSHIGTAKDVCAYISHHTNYKVLPVLPQDDFLFTKLKNTIAIEIKDTTACRRYSGVLIEGLTVTDSPDWLVQHLKSIGIKPINNIVDITNFILHEWGQPLHAFDADKIEGNKVIVEFAAAESLFITLDEKERKLQANDLVISNNKGPMCLAGIYGGANSGVTAGTTRVFLESAWFDPAVIRKSSLAHALRTDAASRFEKVTDVSNTVVVLKRAAALITEIAGGQAGEIIDVYPNPVAKKEVSITYEYLQRLSGKYYSEQTVKSILRSLGFEVLNETSEQLRLSVPFSKPDITIAADLVEEILRIDGLDNIEIPSVISIAPAVEKNARANALKEKIASYLSNSGFNEIFTNSVSNSQWYNESQMYTAVRMLNNLSVELDILRPAMLQSGLQAIAYNLNRKNNNLLFFEFGKTYHKTGGVYKEVWHLCLYVSGAQNNADWKNKDVPADLFFVKGIVDNIFKLAGITDPPGTSGTADMLYNVVEYSVNNNGICSIAQVDDATLKKQDVKQPVLFADFLWETLLDQPDASKMYREISKYPAAQRDLAIVVDKAIPFAQIQAATNKAKLPNLLAMELFDVFENDKLGASKKSMAINYTFADDSRTLTDKEIEGMMATLIRQYEKDLQAEIRK